VLIARRRYAPPTYERDRADAHASASPIPGTALIEHTIVRNLIEFFVLGALPSDLMQEIGDHLSVCTECRDFSLPSRQVAQLLLFAAPPVEPPSRLRGRLRAAVKREAAPKRPNKPASAH
jgi:hypothetical protein